MISLKHVTVILLLLTLTVAMPTSVTGWSEEGHRAISTVACEFLPNPWKDFFCYYAWLLGETSQYPDTLYRPADPNEGPRHYVDLEVWSPNNPSTGTLPQAVNEFTLKMESEIRSGQWNEMFLDAGRVSHYVADLTQPYHTTVNYNPVANGVGLHEVLDSALADHWTELHILTPSDVEPLTPVSNITRFILDLAWQSHSFLPTINRTLIDEGLQWSPELTQIIQNRTNTAILAVARIWYTAIAGAKLPPPNLPRVNGLSIHVEDVSLKTSSISTIRLNVTDLLGVKTYADVRLHTGGSVFRGQVANVIPPVGEYVVILGPGNYLGNLTLTAERNGYGTAVTTLTVTHVQTAVSTEMRVSTSSPSTVPISPSIAGYLPAQTIVGIFVMIVALAVLLVYLKRSKGS